MICALSGVAADRRVPRSRPCKRACGMPAPGPGSTFTDTCGRTQTSPPARRGAVIAEPMDSLRPADDLASEPAYLEVKRLRRFTHRSTARTSTRLLSRISCVGCPRNPQVRALIVLANGSCRKNCCGPTADRSGATMIFAELLDTLAYSGMQNFSYTAASSAAVDRGLR